MKEFFVLSLIGAIYYVLAYTTITLGRIVYNSRGNKAVKEYIKKNLDKLILKQEEVLGIDQPGHPRIVFGIPKNIFSFWERANPPASGMYFSETDTIYLITGNLTTNEINFENTLANIVNLGFTMDAERTFYHEMGHYYTDKLSEYYNGRNWPIYTKYMTDLEVIRTKLVSEGIATYFDNKTTGDEELYNKGSLKMKDFGGEIDNYKSLSHYIYFCGYNLVKPIIDKHGDLGILYLINNPPKAEDLEDLTNYQKKALEFLEFSLKIK